MWRSICYILGVKKPAGTAEEIEKHFGCQSSQLIMVDMCRIVIFPGPVVIFLLYNWHKYNCGRWAIDLSQILFTGIEMGF